MSQILDYELTVLSALALVCIVPFNEIRFNEPLTYVDALGATTPADLLPSQMYVGPDGADLSSSEIYSNVGISVSYTHLTLPTICSV